MTGYCYPDFEELSSHCGSEKSTCCAELHSIGCVLVGSLDGGGRKGNTWTSGEDKSMSTELNSSWEKLAFLWGKPVKICK